MSKFSKVFTVLLVVFSVAFTSMAVSVVSRTTNWKETAERYEQHARVADTNLRNLIAASALMITSAAFIEGFISPSVLEYRIKLGVAVISFIALLSYFLIRA